jgi:hypothetical protein
MKIADSARMQLRALLASGEPDAVLSLLIGYTYDAHRNRAPQVDVTLLPPDVGRQMKRDYAGFGDRLIYEHDGFTFAIPLSGEDGFLEGQMLTYGPAGYSLIPAAAN